MSHNFEEMEVDIKSLVLGGDADFENDRSNSGLDKSSINHLASLIEEQGLINRIVVWCAPDGDHADKYVIISGERRFRAIQQLVKEKKFDGKRIPIKLVRHPVAEINKVRVLAFVDNVGRQDLNGMEISQALKRMVDSGMKQNAIAKACGKSQGWVSLHLSVIKNATPEVQKAWADGKIMDNECFALAKEPAKAQAKKLETVLKIRESGNKSGAVASVKSSTGDVPTVKRPGAVERRVLLEDVKNVTESFYGADTDDYTCGILDALKWTEGELARDKLRPEFFKRLTEAVAARHDAEAAAKADKKTDGDLFDSDDDETSASELDNDPDFTASDDKEAPLLDMND